MSPDFLIAAEHAVLILLVVLGLMVIVLYVVKRAEIAAWSRDGQIWAQRVFSQESPAQEQNWLVAMKSSKPDLSALIWKRAAECRHLVPDALEQVLSAELSLRKRQMEKWVPWVGTIGANAPFVGLTGTVLGILGAFQAMAVQEGSGGAQLMEAISRSLVATAAGLLVAIPAVICYNLLRQKSHSVCEEALELKRLLVARSLQSAAQAWHAEHGGAHGRDQ